MNTFFLHKPDIFTIQGEKIARGCDGSVAIKSISSQINESEDFFSSSTTHSKFHHGFFSDEFFFSSPYTKTPYNIWTHGNLIHYWEFNLLLRRFKIISSRMPNKADLWNFELISWCDLISSPNYFFQFPFLAQIKSTVKLLFSLPPSLSHRHFHFFI